jgi:hypothetical protein
MVKSVYRVLTSPRRNITEELVQFENNDLFFSISEGLFTLIGCLKGQTDNQVYYKEVLTTLHERVRRKRFEMRKNGSWILHHDNAPAQNALSVKTFLAKHRIPMLEHPLYPHVTFFISKDKVCVKRN